MKRATGALLPSQLLYQGLTDKCHPNFNFPKDWDIFHSNVDPMQRYVEKIIVPSIQRVHVRDELDLPLRQKALCISDVYKAHYDKALLNVMEEKGIKVYRQFRTPGHESSK